MIGVNTLQDCTDFDRDAEIWIRRAPRAADGLCKERRANSSFWRVCARGGHFGREKPAGLHRFWSECRDFRSSGSESDCGSGSLKMAGQTYLPAIIRQIGVDFPPP